MRRYEASFVRGLMTEFIGVATGSRDEPILDREPGSERALNSATSA